jgi:hypothetical protein
MTFPDVFVFHGGSLIRSIRCLSIVVTSLTFLGYVDWAMVFGCSFTVAAFGVVPGYPGQILPALGAVPLAGTTGLIGHQFLASFGL